MMTNESTGADMRALMEQAIQEMRRSEGRGPMVGAIVEKDGAVIAVGHRRPGLHAERAAIEAALAVGADLKGATVYSTLEPCVESGSQKECCADLIARVGCSTVYIGRYDPNPLIYREGWKRLRDAGVALYDFPPDLRSQIDNVNLTFAEHFTRGIGPEGGAKFDYLLNEGKFEIQVSPTDERTILTRWTPCGADSIYAFAVQPVQVALARYAREFDEIDDPGALDFNHTVRVSIGEIATFVSEVGAVLVKILAVESGPDYGSPRTSVKIQYSVRECR
jgi:diaminohydroxyphosphoribosylaminopyrimidine deaminase / 5-amino-6-(5-phosphoribosylamino)uracil reductase